MSGRRIFELRRGMRRQLALAPDIHRLALHRSADDRSAEDAPEFLRIIGCIGAILTVCPHVPAPGRPAALGQRIELRPVRRPARSSRRTRGPRIFHARLAPLAANPRGAGVRFDQTRTATLPRIRFADIDSPSVKPLADQIAAERGSVLELYRMLLHSPPVASGWLRYLSAIRRECALPGNLRELAIIRIAIVNGASYEAEQHAAYALREGLSAQQLDDLREWRASPRFDSRQRAVLDYTDAMTQNIRVPEEVFRAVRAHFDDRLLVELTATIGAYNMVSRFLEALEIHAEGKP